MGGSFGDEFVIPFFQDVKGSQVQISEEIGSSEWVVVQQQTHHSVFKPIDHPLEPPPDEDRPVKCPVPPDSSSLLNDGGIRKERSSESLGKRVEQSPVVNDEVLMEVTEPPIQAVRKRHHTLTGDHTTPSVFWGPPLPPLSAKSSTIFQLLQQCDEFEG